MAKTVLNAPVGRLLKIEQLGTDACSEIYDMRAHGATYADISKYLSEGHNFVTNNDQLVRFFRKYGVEKNEIMLPNEVVKNQMLRRKQMERRIDLVSDIIEKQIIEINDSELKPDIKSARIAELCKVMLNTIESDVNSQTDNKYTPKVTNTNVQVNIGDQLKEVAKQKESLKKEILGANFNIKKYETNIVDAGVVEVKVDEGKLPEMDEGTYEEMPEEQ